MKPDKKNEEPISTAFSVVYTPDKDSQIEFDTRNLILHRIGERYILSPPNLPSFNTDSFLITHSSRHDFSMYFADLYPLGLPPKKEQEPQRIFPKVRINYPASSIKSLLNLIVKTVKDSEKSFKIRKTEDQPKPQKMISYRYFVLRNTPTFYANACLIYFNSYTNRVRMIFGYITRGNFTFEDNGESAMDVPIVSAKAEIQMDITSLETLVNPLKIQISKYDKKYRKKESEEEE